MASLLAVAWQREYSEMCGFVKARMALALAQSNTLLLRWERDNEGGIRRCQVMKDGAGMEILQPWMDQ
eukprot:3842872-Ditylum_brightwellii.AAC.1